jgi:hypothetical protein
VPEKAIVAAAAGIPPTTKNSIAATAETNESGRYSMGPGPSHEIDRLDPDPT